MKLLVTGGAGFIGANFVHYWLKNHPEDQLVNLDKLTYAGNLENLASVKDNPSYSFVHGDILDPAAVDKAMRGIDTVVHFAADSHVDRSILDPDPFIKTNIEGTYVLLKAALKNSVKRFHHISTDEVFGALELDSRTVLLKTGLIKGGTRGATDIGYVMKNLFTSPHIRLWPKLKKVIFLAETHLLWPVSFFILTVSALVPPLINPVFKRTVLGFLLPKLSSLILTLSTLALLFYMYLDIKLRKRLSQNTQLRNLPLLLVQWYLLPVVSFILSSLPALEAHTRIILGKKLKYKVTEKV